MVAEKYGGREGHSRHVAATSGICQADGAGAHNYCAPTQARRGELESDRAARDLARLRTHELASRTLPGENSLKCMTS